MEHALAGGDFLIKSLYQQKIQDVDNFNPEKVVADVGIHGENKFRIVYRP